MEPFRLKLKVGVHEFEAEGTEDAVQKQLDIWRELIASPSSSPPAAASPPPYVPPLPPPPFDAGGDDRARYSKIFKHEGRVVALTVPTLTGESATADALVVLLLGQKIYNASDSVTGQELSDGMTMSGLRVSRVDRSWGSHIPHFVIKSGEGRATRYRLNIPGAQRARELAEQLLAQVP